MRVGKEPRKLYAEQVQALAASIDRLELTSAEFMRASALSYRDRLELATRHALAHRARLLAKGWNEDRARAAALSDVVRVFSVKRENVVVLLLQAKERP